APTRTKLRLGSSRMDQARSTLATATHCLSTGCTRARRVGRLSSRRLAGRTRELAATRRQSQPLST
ncbi:hypothetical protein GGH95_005090, partial [Coemansia sp. RSA 1836]